MATADVPVFKVVLLGEPASGKTSLALRAYTGQPASKAYVATLGAQVYPLAVTVRSRETGASAQVGVNVWDVAGQERFGGLRDGYYVGADAAIVLTRATSSASRRAEALARWAGDFRRAAAGRPVFVVLTRRREDPVVRLSAQEMVATNACGSCAVELGTREVLRPLEALLRLLRRDDSLELRAIRAGSSRQLRRAVAEFELQFQEVQAT